METVTEIMPITKCNVTEMASWCNVMGIKIQHNIMEIIPEIMS